MTNNPVHEFVRLERNGELWDCSGHRSRSWPILHAPSRPCRHGLQLPVCWKLHFHCPCCRYHALMALALLTPDVIQSDWGRCQQQVRVEPLPSVGTSGSCCPNYLVGAGGDGKFLRGNWGWQLLMVLSDQGWGWALAVIMSSSSDASIRCKHCAELWHMEAKNF